MRFTDWIIVYAFLALCVALVSGCTEIADWSVDNPEQVEGIQTAIEATGAAASPWTGGLSSVIAGAVSAFLPTVLAVNRAVVAKQRGDAIKEIDGDRTGGATRAKDRTRTGKSRATVEAVTG